MAPLTFVPEDRLDLLQAYASELRTMNRALNLVSRSVVDRIMEDHVMHCLTLAMRPFPEGSRVVDWGSGGGLPAIPLAICFPAVQFTAVDSIRKKTDAVRMMARRLGLTNVGIRNTRAELFDGSIDFAVSRATAGLDELWKWTFRALDVNPEARQPRAPSSGTATPWPRGLICLKGGEIDAEWTRLTSGHPYVVREQYPLAARFDRPDWDGKYIVCLHEGSSI